MEQETRWEQVQCPRCGMDVNFEVAAFSPSTSASAYCMECGTSFELIGRVPIVWSLSRITHLGGSVDPPRPVRETTVSEAMRTIDKLVEKSLRSHLAYAREYSGIELSKAWATVYRALGWNKGAEKFHQD